MGRRVETVTNISEENAPPAPPVPPATIIIALTASAFKEERDNFLEAGCDDFVIKPFREEVIFSKMAHHLGVRYIFEEPTSVSSSQGGASQMLLTSESFAVMPAGWVVQLHQAARSLDFEQTNRLIAQIPEPHVSLAIALTNLLNDFRFDKIMDLTQPHAQ